MRLIAAALLTIGMLSAPAFAGDHHHHKMGDKEMTKEQREKMAAHHEKMAACMRSDKKMSECRDEMMKSCEADGNCPMHAMHGKGKHKCEHHGSDEDGAKEKKADKKG